MSVENAAVYTDVIAFTDETWVVVGNARKRNFPGMDIVGWYLNSDTISMEDNKAVITKEQTTDFSESDKIFLNFTPAKNLFGLYYLDEEELKEESGYYEYSYRDAKMADYLEMQRIVIKQTTDKAAFDASDNSDKAELIEEIEDSEEVSETEEVENEEPLEETSETGKTDNEDNKKRKTVKNTPKKADKSEKTDKTDESAGESKTGTHKSVKKIKKQLTFVYVLSIFLIAVVLVVGINEINRKDHEELTTSIIARATEIPETTAAPTTRYDETTPVEIVTVAPTTAEPETTEPATEEPTSEPATEAPTTAAPSTDYDVYVVKKGNSFFSICQAFYGQQSMELVQKILDANGMNINSPIIVGMELKIPKLK